MINIGIEKNEGLVYEGSSNYGRAVWPTPVVTPAKFVFPSDGEIKAESSSNVFGYRFREDSFDPISRVRRGRFYLASQSQPTEWYVQPHPAMPLEAMDVVEKHEIRKSLETFNGNPIWHKYIQGKQETRFTIALIFRQACSDEPFLRCF